MGIESLDGPIESTNATLISRETSEWNGKEVQMMTTAKHAWLVLQIPIQTPEKLPKMEEKVTSATPSLPTVEQVLERYNLKLASSLWAGKDVKQMATKDKAWVVIPLQTEGSNLENRVTPIDANDFKSLEQILENCGVLTCPRSFWPHFPTTTLV